MQNIILLISGKQGSGKTTLAQNLFNNLTKDDNFWVYSLKFADPLYEMYEQIWRVMEKFGEPRPVKIDGTLLQLLGTEWGRKNVRENLWCEILQNRVAQIINHTAQNRSRVFIVDDARFPNEIDAFDKLVNVKVLKVRLEASEYIRRQRAAKWRNAVTHPSEIALDSYSKWDHVIFTDKHNGPETLKLVERQLSTTIKN